MSGQEATSIYTSESWIKARIPMGFYNNSDIVIRDSNFKSSHIKKGTSIFGIEGTYSETPFAQNLPLVIDLSGFKQVLMAYYKNGGYKFLNEPLIYQHSTESIHYFCCLLRWYNFSNKSCYGLTLIGKYDKVSNQIYFYEKNLGVLSARDDYWSIGQPDIKIVDNLIYFSNYVYYRRNDSSEYKYAWVSFNGNSFNSGSGSALPYNESTLPNNISLTYNGKTWKPYLEYNTKKSSGVYSLTCRFLLKNI